MVSQPSLAIPASTGCADLTDNVSEYHNKTITRIFGGNAHLGCYFLTVCIFSAGILRDHLCVHLEKISSPVCTCSTST
jgi:hypothetical protein